MEDDAGGGAFRVLVVDAAAEDRVRVRGVVERCGCECLEAATGREGLALARQAGPDLVLLDWGLPDLDGLEVARRLKARPETRRIPVTLLGGPGAPLVLLRGVGPWPAEVLRKPVDPAALEGVVWRARRARDARLRLAELGRSVRGSPLAFAADGPLTRRALGQQVAAELGRLRAAGVPVALLRVGLALPAGVAPDRAERRALANQVAERVRGCTRPEDLAAAGAGGTFVVLLAGLGARAAGLVAGKVRAALEGEPFRLGGREVRAIARVEVAHWTAGADPVTRAVLPGGATPRDGGAGLAGGTRRIRAAPLNSRLTGQ